MSEVVKSRTVGIVDYLAGNIYSLGNALEYVGARVVPVRSQKDMMSCTHLVLPGVGAFGFCADRLRASKLTPNLRHWAFDLQRPLLGICVGMQMLGDSSEESPNQSGLGWIGGNIERLHAEPSVHVPHVGWNTVSFVRAYGEFCSGDKVDFYFDHSFAYGQPRIGDVVGYAMHGREFSAVIQRDNVTAVQFHPEKSQAAGLRVLSGFLRQ